MCCCFVEHHWVFCRARKRCCRLGAAVGADRARAANAALPLYEVAWDTRVSPGCWHGGDPDPLIKLPALHHLERTSQAASKVFWFWQCFYDWFGWNTTHAFGMETARFFKKKKTNQNTKPHKSSFLGMKDKNFSSVKAHNEHTAAASWEWGWTCVLYHLCRKVLLVPRIYLYCLPVRIQFLSSVSFAWLLGCRATEHKAKELQGSFDRWALHSARHCDSAGKLFSYVSYYLAF